MIPVKEISLQASAWWDTQVSHASRAICYHLWSVDGLKFTLRELYEAGWDLRIKQSRPGSRIKIIFHKGNSFISFRSRGHLSYRDDQIDTAMAIAGMVPERAGVVDCVNRHDESQIVPEDVATIKLPLPHYRLIKAINPRTFQPCLTIAVKNLTGSGLRVIGQLGEPIKEFNQHYQMWLANKRAVFKPTPEEVPATPPDPEVRFMKTFTRGGVPVLENIDTGEQYPISATPQPTPEEVSQLVAESVNPLLKYSDKELLDEIISREVPRKRKRKPLTADNIIQIKEWLRRSEAILGGKERDAA